MESALARWLGGYHTEIDVRGVHTLQGDEGSHHPGGNDLGPSPSEMLLAAAASCMCMAVAHVARKRHLEVGTLSVEALGEADLAAFKFAEIRLVVRASLPREDLAPVVELAARYCWVSNTLLSGCPVTTAVEPIASAEGRV